MTGLAADFLLAALSQTLGLTMKAIRGRWQMAVVTILGEPGFQLLDPFAQHSHLFSQHLILFSQLFQFFFFGHAGALLACSLFGKPLVLLVSY